MTDSKKKLLGKICFDVIPLVIAVGSILFFGLTNLYNVATGKVEGSVPLCLFKLLPTLISPVVLILGAHANRYSFLIGGTNSLLYGANNFIEGLYFSTFTACAISFPVQLFSFFNWKKNSEKSDDTNNSEVKLRFMSWRVRLVTFVIMAAAWVFFYYGIGRTLINSNQMFLDTLNFVLGITATFLMAFRYVESMYMTGMACSISFIIWLILSADQPANVNFLINSAYNVYCAVQGSTIWTAKYLRSKRREREKALDAQ